jgi:hypothetical protein
MESLINAKPNTSPLMRVHPSADRRNRAERIERINHLTGVTSFRFTIHPPTHQGGTKHGEHQT